MEQALKKLADARVFLAAGDLDHAFQEMKPALQELMNAQKDEVNTTAMQRTLVEGAALRVGQAVRDVEAVVGSSNSKVREANTLLEQGTAWLQQERFKDAFEAFSKALQKVSRAG